MAKKQGNPVRRLRDLALPFRVAAGIMFGTIVALTIAQVFFRFVLDSPLIWSEELSRLLLVWVTFVGAAVVCWDGGHINIDTFFMRIPMPYRRWLRAFNGAVAVVFLAILVYHSITLVRIEHITTLGALDISASYVRLPATVGGGLMILYIVLRWVYRLPIEREHAGDDADIDREPM